MRSLSKNADVYRHKDRMQVLMLHSDLLYHATVAHLMSEVDVKEAAVRMRAKKMFRGWRFFDVSIIMR